MLLRLLLVGLCSTCTHAFAIGVAGPPAAAARLPAIAAAPARCSEPTMGILDFLQSLIYDKPVEKKCVLIFHASRAHAPPEFASHSFILFSFRRPSAGSSAMSRLKVVLAQDRTGLDEATLTKIRKEIQDVISKYVTIDLKDVQFDMQSDNDVTLCTASFPLLQRERAGAGD